MLKNNNWQVSAIEHKLSGNFADAALDGRADLILQRGKEWAIIDLKWRGIGRRRQMLKNLEDLQLIINPIIYQSGIVLFSGSRGLSPAALPSVD